MAESRTIFAPAAVVLNIEAPVIVRTPVSTMSPKVAVAVSAPPIPVVPKSNPLASVMVTAPVPVLEIVTVPPISKSRPCAPPEPPIAAPLAKVVVSERLPVVVIAAPVSSSSLMVLLETRETFFAPNVSSSRVMAPEVRVWTAKTEAPFVPAVDACPKVRVPVVVILSSSVSVNIALAAVPKAKVSPFTDRAMLTFPAPALIVPTIAKSFAISVTAPPPVVVVVPDAKVRSPTLFAAPEVL